MSSWSSVMFVVLAIWVALFLYLWRLDARVREICARGAEAAPEQDAPAAVLETPRQLPKG